jgi:hypothetical protein
VCLGKCKNTVLCESETLIQKVISGLVQTELIIMDNIVVWLPNIVSLKSTPQCSWWRGNGLSARVVGLYDDAWEAWVA